MDSLLLLLLLLLSALAAAAQNRSFTIDYKGSCFRKDGQPFQYVSGSFHYFRVPRQYWHDRLLKMRAAGLDAVQIYVPWNWHQPEEGVTNFSDDRDLELLLATANKLGLLAIVRVGPYICAEWDFGGLPGWLLRKNASMVMRSNDEQFMSAVTAWMSQLLPLLRRHLYQAGGSVIMVQLENEYGSTGQCDLPYLRALHSIARRLLGNETVLFSTDGNGVGFLLCTAHMRDLVYPTVDFGTGTANNPADAFAPLRLVVPDGPLVNSEFYSGWLDHWRENHSRVDANSVAEGLQHLLDYGASVNIYMFVGGTNFGFWNGANYPPLLPQPTSYDYDAPVSENGDTTLKYQAIRAVVLRHRRRRRLRQAPLPPVPPNITTVSLPPARVRRHASLFASLNAVTVRRLYSQLPAVMESLRQYFGFALYASNELPLPTATGMARLQLPQLRDFAYVFVATNGSGGGAEFAGSVGYFAEKLELVIPLPPPAATAATWRLWILVENCGHVNYGSGLQGNTKGLGETVTVNGANVTGWTSYMVDFGRVAAAPEYSRSADKWPGQGSLYTGSLVVSDQSQLGDTFANMSTFCKGQLWINGHNVGRFWPCAGPQETLYVPAPFLRLGANQLTLLELLADDCGGQCRVDFLSRPRLGHSQGQRGHRDGLGGHRDGLGGHRDGLGGHRGGQVDWKLRFSVQMRPGGDAAAAADFDDL